METSGSTLSYEQLFMTSDEVVNKRVLVLER